MSFFESSLSEQGMLPAEKEYNRLKTQLHNVDTKLEFSHKISEKTRKQIVNEMIQKTHSAYNENFENSSSKSHQSLSQSSTLNSFNQSSSMPTENTFTNQFSNRILQRTTMRTLMKKIGIQDPTHFVRGDLFEDSIQLSYQENIDSIASEYNEESLVSHLPHSARRAASAFQKLYMLSVVCYMFSSFKY